VEGAGSGVGLVETQCLAEGDVAVNLVRSCSAYSSAGSVQGCSWCCGSPVSDIGNYLRERDSLQLSGGNAVCQETLSASEVERR